MRDWLVELRKSKGLTQEVTAQKAHIARSYYTRIELGEYRLPVGTAMRIAEALDFDWVRYTGTACRSGIFVFYMRMCRQHEKIQE